MNLNFTRRLLAILLLFIGTFWMACQDINCPDDTLEYYLREIKINPMEKSISADSEIWTPTDTFTNLILFETETTVEFAEAQLPKFNIMNTAYGCESISPVLNEVIAEESSLSTSAAIYIKGEESIVRIDPNTNLLEVEFLRLLIEFPNQLLYGNNELISFEINNNITLEKGLQTFTAQWTTINGEILEDTVEVFLK